MTPLGQLWVDSLPAKCCGRCGFWWTCGFYPPKVANSNYYCQAPVNIDQTNLPTSVVIQQRTMRARDGKDCPAFKAREQV